MTTRIRTARLVIRRARPEDADAIVGIWCNPEVMTFMHGPRDEARVRAAIAEECAEAENPVSMWSVEEPLSGRVIGDCGLIRKEIEGREEVEIVYLFAKGAWGQGYATEAARAVCAHAFGPLALPRLCALIVPGNAASIRVAEKIGMRHLKDVERPSRTMRLYGLDAPQIVPPQR